VRTVARWKADLSLVGITFIWGTTFVLVKSALDDVSTLLFLGLRFSLAAAVLAILARRVRIDRALVAGSLLVGTSLFAGYLLQTLGLRWTTPSKSAFITAFSVPLVPVLMGLAFRRFAGWGPLGGITAATAGLYFLTVPAGIGALNRGDLLTLGCALAFALHIILLGRFTRVLPTLGLAAGQIIVAALLSLAAVPWAEPATLRFSAVLLIAIVVTGLFATALAFSVMTWAQRYTTPTYAALIFSLEPLFAWLASWALMGEQLRGREVLGAFLILAGVIAAELLRSKEEVTSDE